MAKRTNKSVMINTRVTPRMKSLLLKAAEARGETEAMIVRDALNEYFEQRAMVPPRPRRRDLIASRPL